MTYYTNSEAAEAAGFRPCKRCRPDTAGPAKRHADIVTRACRMIESSDEPPTLDALAADLD